MKGIRRTLVFVLFIVMTIAFCLTGCQQDKANTDSTDSSKTEEVKATESTQEETAEAIEQLEPVTISMRVIFPQQPDQEIVLEAFNTMLKEKINY